MSMNGSRAMLPIPERNAIAVAEKLREMDARLYTMQEAVILLQQQVTNFAIRLQNVESYIMQQRVKEAGHGPSARS
jgi:hypothetical protein